jgi:hypothetical protein
MFVQVHGVTYHRTVGLVFGTNVICGTTSILFMVSGGIVTGALS